MKIAYLDCPSGISGDMTLAALVDVGVDLAEIQRGINSLGVESCRLVVEETKRHGFRAKNLTVEYPPEHAHRHLHHITAMIDGSALSNRQQDLARQIFARLAEAEAKVHGSTIEKVHFHEVGAVDSIADIVGTAIGFDLLGVERIECSPIPTGHGFVQIAHGRCSIPAPATAELLCGVPLAESPVQAELTTPTGAAIVSTLVHRFGPLPPMTIERIGYGAGDRDFETQANLLRLIVGNTIDPVLREDRVEILETNLDDVAPEIVGYTTQKLMSSGALDVYTTPIQMKKNRPAIKITVICESSQRPQLESILLAETKTLGIRRWSADRTTLPREAVQVDTPWGAVRGKIAQTAQPTFTPEYDDCATLASEHNVSLHDVMFAARQAFSSAEKTVAEKLTIT